VTIRYFPHNQPSLREPEPEFGQTIGGKNSHTQNVLLGAPLSRC
jgi:hypothetical protein